MWIKLSTWKFRRAERRRRTNYKVKNDLNKEEEEPQQPNPFLKNANPKSKKYPFLQTQIKTQPHGSFDLGACVAGLRRSMHCWVLMMYLSKV